MHKNKRIPTTKKREYQNIYQDRRWKSLRWMQIRNFPLCAECLKVDPPVAVPAREVDHIIPWSEGSTDQERENLAFDQDNLQSLCIPHHKKKHQK